MNTNVALRIGIVFCLTLFVVLLRPLFNSPDRQQRSSVDVKMAAESQITDQLHPPKRVARRIAPPPRLMSTADAKHTSRWICTSHLEAESSPMHIGSKMSTVAGLAFSASPRLLAKQTEEDQSIWLRNACYNGYVVVDGHRRVVAQHQGLSSPTNNDAVRISKEYCRERRIPVRRKRHSAKRWRGAKKARDGQVQASDHTSDSGRVGRHKLQGGQRRQEVKRFHTRLYHARTGRYICFNRLGRVRIMTRKQADLSGSLCLFKETVVNATVLTGADRPLIHASSSEISPPGHMTRSQVQASFLQLASAYNPNWLLGFDGSSTSRTETGHAVTLAHNGETSAAALRAREIRFRRRVVQTADLTAPTANDCDYLFTTGRVGESQMRHHMQGLNRRPTKSIGNMNAARVVQITSPDVINENGLKSAKANKLVPSRFKSG